MATVGLRLGLRLRPAGGSLVRAGSRQLPLIPHKPTMMQGIARPPLVPTGSYCAIREHNTTASNNDHFFMAEFGLFADFYRPPFKHWPPLFSKEGWKFMKQSFAESYRGIWSFIMVKYNLNGWKKAKFAKEAEDLYKVMNEAYAQGDLVTIESICMPMLYGKMKADIKRRQTDFDWEVVQSVSKPKVIKIRCGNVAPKVSIGQVTVRIDQIQRVAPVPRSGGGGGPKRLVHAKNAKPRDTHVVEYLVFQRLLKDEFSPWLLYKKINVPEWDLPKQKK